MRIKNETIVVVCTGIALAILAMLFFIAGFIGESLSASIIGLIFVGVGIIMLIR